MLASFKYLTTFISGSRWVGWSSDRKSDNSLNIIFEFDGIREFSAVHLHANNMFTRGVQVGYYFNISFFFFFKLSTILRCFFQVFSKAHVYFSINGEKYKSTTVIANIPADKIHESARNVTILLHGHLGKFVRICLHFSSKWLLLSEITFESSKLIIKLSTYVGSNWVNVNIFSF